MRLNSTFSLTPMIVSTLELKVPPVPLALILGGLMWLASVQLPTLAFVVPWRVTTASAIGLSGFAFALAGAVAFRKAATTLNPMRPATASALVTSGIYRFSRNPMYVGLLLALTGWTVFLSHALGLLFLPTFVAYMNRFQIAPEEYMLAEKFGVASCPYFPSRPFS